MKTFSCNFGNGIECQIQVSDTPPAKGSGHIQKITWTGDRSMKVIEPYITWMCSVQQTLADEWGITILHIIQKTPKTMEKWVFKPGGKPEQVH